MTQTEALKLAREYVLTHSIDAGKVFIAIEEALAQPEQEAEYRCCPHDSDCAVHNMPAYPAGPCDCTYKNTHNLPPSAVVHEVCLALTKRALEKIEHENFGRMPNDSWANKVLDVYHFFDSNPKAKKLTVIYTTPPQRKPLTDEQIDAVANAAFKGYMADKNDDFDRAFARAIETAHGIKGDA